MEKVRKVVKKYYLRQIMTYWLACWMFFGLPAQVAMAAVSGGNFQVGTGSIDHGPHTDVIVNQMESVITWGSLDTAFDESLTFTQGALSNAAVLNRVVGDGALLATFFDGTLTGTDMRIFMVNPAGIVFGDSATINVAQLVASGLGMSNDAFHNVLSDVANKMVFDNSGTGKVENYGDITATDSVYLVGTTVKNNGSIVCPDGLVVLAAGNEVKLGQPGSSVIVDLANDFYITDNDLYNSGSDGINAKNVVLAAGDIWSSALIEAQTLRAEAKGNVNIDGIINAYSDGGSDAVATIDIIAGGNVTVDAEITAEAEAEGETDSVPNNAFATVTIDAGGELHVNALVKAEADAEEGAGNATALVDISADASVTINDTGDEYAVEADAWVDENSGDATATLNITAGGDVDIYDDVAAEADTRDNSGNAVSKAEINADGDVGINDGFKARSEAVDSGNATAHTKITGENMDLDGWVVNRAITDNSGDAVGNIVITARGDLIVNDVKSKVASVRSGNATSDIKISGVNIDAGWILSKATAGLHLIEGSGDTSGNSGDATAGVDIAATGIVTVDNRVQSYAEAQNNSGSADATTKIVGTDINIEDGGGGDESLSVAALAETYDNSGNATADVEIEATTGNVLIDSDGYPVLAEATVENPDTEYEGDATANMKITAAGDIDIYDLVKAEAGTDDYSGSATADIMINAGGNVYVTAEHYSTATIHAEAYYGYDNTATVDVTANNGNVEVYGYEYGYAGIEAEAYDAENNNTAEVTVTAKGDGNETGNVIVEANNDSEAWIESYAYEAENSNSATTTINAAGDVIVEADDSWGYEGWYGAGIGAYANYDDESNTAKVEITAGGYVEVIAENGQAWIEAIASYGVTNTAGIDITANNGYVLAMADGGNASIEAAAYEGMDNTATVNVTAKGESIEEEDHIGSVGVIASGESEAWIGAYTWDAENSNSSTVTINADSDVEVDAGYYSWAAVEASAGYDDESNTADITINAGGNVEVTAEHYSTATIHAEASNGYDNTANIQITTEDGGVLVESMDADASIEAVARWAENTNNATVDIDAVGGDVTVIDYGEMHDTAKITATAEYAAVSNSADVQITATATAYEDDGEEYVNGGNVSVLAYDGGHAEIKAYANDAYGQDVPIEEQVPTSNTANVTINATGVEVTESVIVDEIVTYDDFDQLIIEYVYEDVTYTEGGDVTVEAENDSEAAIQAVTLSANENDSDVLICAEGEVVVSDENSQGPTAKILSSAQFGYINDAYTGVRGAEGISVLGYGGHASIASEAMYGLDCMLYPELNTAFTSLCTDGDVVLAGLNYGTAEVLALAKDGLVNDAAVGVCADGDVLVAAGLYGMGGTAKIKSEAQAAYVYIAPPPSLDEPTNGTVATFVPQEPQEPTSATANTTVVSHNGGVGVIDEQNGRIPATASIEAEAYNSNENNAYVGVAAGADLKPEDLVEPPLVQYELPPIEQWLENIRPGDVYVEGIGSTAKASIISKAYQGPVNTAETVVCAPGEVVVQAFADGGQPIAQIKSQAGWFGNEESLNDAATRIYASDVYVYVPGLYRGNAVWAYAAGNDDNPRVPGEFLSDILDESYTGEYYDTVEHGEVVYGDGDEDNATLIIQDYSERTDLPVAPPCPDCDDEPIEPPVGPFPAPLGVAPLPALQEIVFGQGGCPALMAWLATEVGVAVDVQVFLAGAFVSSTDCQPCESAAKLKAAATVLTDEDGSAMAAMNQVFNPNVPFTPEMATSLANDTGAQYAAAREYIDALVQYIAILNTEMGSPVADSVAYVMEKYGSGITGSGNEDMSTFVASRLESGETYAQ